MIERLDFRYASRFVLIIIIYYTEVISECILLRWELHYIYENDSRISHFISQDKPEETHSPARDLSEEQQHIDEEMEGSENNTDQQQSEDLELLSNENKLHRPYRDTKRHVTEKNFEDDVTSQPSSVTTSSMDSREIRTRVKKSLDKKQRDMRRRKRGEASAVTRSRRENRDAVKHGAQSWHDGW